MTTTARKRIPLGDRHSPTNCPLQGDPLTVAQKHDRKRRVAAVQRELQRLGYGNREARTAAFAQVCATWTPGPGTESTDPISAGPVTSWLEEDHSDLCASCLYPLASEGPMGCAAHVVPFRKPKRLGLPEFDARGYLADDAVLRLNHRNVPTPRENAYSVGKPLRWQQEQEHRAIAA